MRQRRSSQPLDTHTPFASTHSTRYKAGRRPDTTKVWNFKGSFRDTLGDRVSSLPGALKNSGWLTTGMGKVYHPGHPKDDDGALSWSLDFAPYYHPSNYSGTIDNRPDVEFQDGAITAIALQRLRALKNQTKPFFIAVGLHKPHVREFLCF